MTMEIEILYHKIKQLPCLDALEGSCKELVASRNLLSTWCPLEVGIDQLVLTEGTFSFDYSRYLSLQLYQGSTGLPKSHRIYFSRMFL